MRYKFCFVLLFCLVAWIKTTAQIEIEQRPFEEDIAPEVKKPVKEDNHFKVGIFLPFFKDGNDTTPQKHAFAMSSLDYLAGVKIAIDSLEKISNLKIDFYVEDTELDSSIVEELLMQTKYKDLDVLIGPIFQSGVTMAQTFMHTRKTVIYLPFEKEFTFLNIGKHISDQKNTSAFASYFSYYFLQKFVNSNKHFVLIYNSKEGKLGRESREVDSLVKINLSEKTDSTLITLIDIASKENATFSTSLNKRHDFVFFINTKNTYYANIALNQIKKLDSEAPEVYCLEEILESEPPLYELWDSLHMKFFSRFFINYDDEATGLLRKKMIEGYNEEPVEFTYKGYNDILFLANAFAEGEEWLEKCQQRNFANEVSGFYYTSDLSGKSIYNGYHSIWRYDHLKLYRAN